MRPSCISRIFAASASSSAFSPNTVTFDLQNAPYIAVGVAGVVDVVHPSDAATDGVVQTLDASGQWIRLSYVDAIRARYPTWNGLFSSGLEKVVFDAAGDAYLLSNHTRSSNIGAQLLLYSRDKARTWQVYQLPSFGVGTKAHIEAPVADCPYRVILILLAYCNRDTYECWPSQAAIQRASGYGRSAVNRALRTAKALKLFHSETIGAKEMRLRHPQIKANGKHRYTIYTLNPSSAAWKQHQRINQEYARQCAAARVRSR